MPVIRLSVDLRNSYNDISSFCHQYGESVLRGIVGHQDKAENCSVAESNGAIRCIKTVIQYFWRLNHMMSGKLDIVNAYLTHKITAEGDLGKADILKKLIGSAKKAEKAAAKAEKKSAKTAKKSK